MANALIIDDEKILCSLLSDMLKMLGHETTVAFTAKEGLREALSREFDVVFLDVNLPDRNGLEILSFIRNTKSSPEVFIITGIGDQNGAEISIKNGAWDYIQKPINTENLLLQLKRVFQYRENSTNNKSTPIALNMGGIIGSSAPMRGCIDSLAKAACSKANVLITGETGTGKELFSRAVHDNSSKSKGEFIVVDCAALPETLVESALFGHRKGSFTGASESRNGLIKEADKGTLFLDEVGELSPNIQKKFLRVLQERQFRPIGGKDEVHSDFRLIAATNRNLEQLSDDGKFRKDLLYRLRTITIDLPPLRSHPDDIKDIALYHTIRLCENYGIPTKGFSPDFFDTLMAYEWPGNVRELVHSIETALTESIAEPMLYSKHLPDHIRIKVASAFFEKDKKINIQQKKDVENYIDELPKFHDFVDEYKIKYLKELMNKTGGNIPEACFISGLSRSSIYEYLKCYNLNK